jgi:probable selenium-dependent hydroxylase accessory protein YqeC
VVSPRADLVIAAIGVDCLGAPMDDAHVHRAALLRERLGRLEGAAVTAADVAGIVLHRNGYLARVARDTEVIVFVNQVAMPQALADARRLADALQRADTERRLARVIIGDVRAGVFENAGWSRQVG